MKTRSPIVLGLLLVATASAWAGDEEARQVAETHIARWNAAFAKGKVDDIVSLYADNAMLVQPNGAVSKSAGEIRAFWQNLIEKKGGVLSIDIVDAKGEKEGTIVTKATLSDVKMFQNTQHAMRYHYDGVLYSVLKRQSDGSWKAQVQQWSYKTKS